MADDVDVPGAVDQLRGDDLLDIGECREAVSAHAGTRVGLESIAPGTGLLEAAGLGQGGHALVDRRDHRAGVAAEGRQCLLGCAGVRIRVA